jgi:hypothetical protein
MADTWRHIAQPGTWLTSAERLAVAAEVRIAQACELCEARAKALSSMSVQGQHASFGELKAQHVELVHRLRRDHARLSKAWLDKALVEGMGDGEYVETVSVVALVTALDTFADAMGVARETLPATIPGKISRYRPACARATLAWVATIDPDEATGAEADIYAGQTAANIHRALTLVPNEKRAFFALDDVMYLPDNALRKFDGKFREIDHGQIELLAARVSALNHCYY